MRTDHQRIGIHFLDNVIDVNPYPLKEIDAITKANRKIGLGVMGFAELLIRLGIPYDSDRSAAAWREDCQIPGGGGREDVRGAGRTARAVSELPGQHLESTSPGRRNATVTTVAPTGTISIIAGCSSGIEPLFAIAFMRHVLGGERLFEINPIFERMAKDRGFYSGDLLEKIARQGTVKDMKEVPEDVRRLFVTAHDICPGVAREDAGGLPEVYRERRLKDRQPARRNATPEDIEKVYRLAYELKCKGVTVYRYGSKGEQVLNLGRGERGGEEGGDRLRGIRRREAIDHLRVLR